ncbi:unnamed protein product [Fraxinus pennsylvanica]|uniref:RuvB-like AAA-lid domain-containing protein n=1 Tax=Fraxinus pennsylvanica TaxID=56036 RepID=A0AAD1ZV91_9LAMI|nr:unnamed protein product [Fraxinus pennsylvanica]
MSRHQFILSLLHRHQHHRRAIQQLHSLFLVHEIENANIVLTVWNSIIKHYSLGSLPNEAIFLFKHLIYKYKPVFFDSFTYSYLIKACANLKRTRVGNQLHCLSGKVGFEFHVYVQTAVVNMYLDCGSLVEAKKVFDEMPERNLVTWNVLISGFCKWGEIESARAVFDVMPEKNVVSWTGLIDGYTRMNRFNEALSLFQRMVVHEGIKPTEVSLLAIYPAIWNVRAQVEELQIHEKSLAYLGDIGQQASLRHAVELLSLGGSIVAKMNDRGNICKVLRYKLVENSSARHLQRNDMKLNGTGKAEASALVWFINKENFGRSSGDTFTVPASTHVLVLFFLLQILLLRWVDWYLVL